MLGHEYLSILNFIFMIYSCKCQNLDKYVAPILDNRGAPLVAIVDTTNISSHIVRSIEMPLREIINTTIECKINEELQTVKQDIATLRIDTEETFSHIIHERKNFTKVVDTVNADLDEKVKNFKQNVDLMKSGLQQTFDEHIGDKRNQFTEVKEDIATLRKEMEEKITNEIFKQMKNFTEIFNTLNKDLDEKVKNLNNIVEIVQTELRETILSVNNNASNLVEQLETHSNRLDVLRSNIQELTVNTNAIQSGMNNLMSTANVKNGRLRSHESRLDNLNAKVNVINSRAFLSAWVPDVKTMSTNEIIPFTTINAQHGISRVSSMTSRGEFTCEKAGYYLVSFFVTSKSLKAEAKLLRNSVKIARTMKSGDSNYESHAATTITQLNTGDVLSVKADINDMNVYNTFDSGFTILQIY
ncbi:uncharacterized protein LOC127706095 isoform X2 [Mytilus californianus]|uniref:uncharacterized protein LOC127706095 isoform X2 n=1 Tax=Mytilus californianus TaxID=6549 RepID=UPI00224505FF|nr:uncharacterized protein LOC127706095 isoform X2 [Mytilus californianus]